MKWPMRLRVERQERLMDAMMERLGIDPLVLARQASGKVFATSLRRCILCPNSTECGRWIERRADPSIEVPGFCPNVHVFAEAQALTRQDRSSE